MRGKEEGRLYYRLSCSPEEGRKANLCPGLTLEEEEMMTMHWFLCPSPMPPSRLPGRKEEEEVEAIHSLLLSGGSDGGGGS